MSRKIDKNKGYILTWRSDQDDLLYFSEPFSKYAAWVDLNMMANFEEKSFLLGNEVVNAEVGSVITSELRLMNRWQWGKEKVRNFLKLLEKLDYIERHPDHKKTVIIIKDYSESQTAERRLKSMDSSEKATTKGLALDFDKTEQRPSEVCKETMNQTQTIHYKDIENIKEGITENTNIHNKGTTNINPPKSPKGNNTRKQSKEALINTFKDMVDKTELSDILKNKVKEWIDYKNEIKNPYKSEKGFNQFLSILINHTLTHSDQEIINVIDRTMASEYKGIVWEWLEKSHNNTKSNYIDSINNRVNQVDSWI